VANALRTEVTEEGGQGDPVEVHLSKENDAFLARAELNRRDAEKVKHCVHVYEAYWAPLTEGKVTYWDTLKFLFGAAWTCFQYSRGKFAMDVRRSQKPDDWVLGASIAPGHCSDPDWASLCGTLRVCGLGADVRAHHCGSAAAGRRYFQVGQMACVGT
jgi:hypothetical protein